jgi:NtrC-family two-component system sensor histidine kinase KinB
MRRLSTQLLLSHLLLVLLMGFVMSAAIKGLFGLSAMVNHMADHNLQSITAGYKIRDGFEGVSKAASLYSTSPGDALLLYETSSDSLQNEVPLADQAADTDVDRLALREISNEASSIDAMFAHLQHEKNPKERIRLRDEIRNAAFLGARGATKMSNDNAEAADTERRSISANAYNDSRWSVLYTFIAVVAAVVLASRMVRLALRPLALLAKQAEVIGAGEDAKTIHLGRNDEVGALADSFNEMAMKLADLRKMEERRLRRAQKMTDSALESLYDPVIIADAKGRIVHLNRAAEALFGPAPESPRAPVVEHIGDERIVRAIRKAIERQSVSAMEDETAIVPLKLEGADRTFRLRAAPMKDDDGTLLGSVVVLEDITHLRQLDRLKTDFIGVASHELRTPITSLLLSNELMAEGAAGELTPDQRVLVDAQTQDLQRLERLTRELLDLTRMEAGSHPPKFEMVAADQLARGAAQSVRSQAQDKGVQLIEEISEGLPDVRADKSQVTRVLVNLLNNAIRHTPKGGSVRVRAALKGNQVTFEVADTGEGIPPDYLAKIFDRFVQVPGATQGGAGLGLSIAQRIVKAHGGVMQVRSEIGKGSTFSFTIGTDREGDGDEQI